jgi:hypothetical protein
VASFPYRESHPNTVHRAIIKYLFRTYKTSAKAERAICRIITHQLIREGWLYGFTDIQPMLTTIPQSKTPVDTSHGILQSFGVKA